MDNSSLAHTIMNFFVNLSFFYHFNKRTDILPVTSVIESKRDSRSKMRLVKMIIGEYSFQVSGNKDAVTSFKTFLDSPEMKIRDIPDLVRWYLQSFYLWKYCAP